MAEMHIVSYCGKGCDLLNKSFSFSVCPVLQEHIYNKPNFLNNWAVKDLLKDGQAKPVNSFR